MDNLPLWILPIAVIVAAVVLGFIVVGVDAVGRKVWRWWKRGNRADLTMTVVVGGGEAYTTGCSFDDALTTHLTACLVSERARQDDIARSAKPIPYAPQGAGSKPECPWVTREELNEVDDARAANVCRLSERMRDAEQRLAALEQNMGIALDTLPSHHSRIDALERQGSMTGSPQGSTAPEAPEQSGAGWLPHWHPPIIVRCNYRTATDALLQAEAWAKKYGEHR